MWLLNKVSTAVDSMVGVFSPQAAIVRGVDRWKLAKLREKRFDLAAISRERAEMYAAAKSHRSIGNWSPTNTNVNDIIAASNFSVMSRVRQLVRDFPVFNRAVNVSLDHIIGSGLKFQSHVQKSGTNNEFNLPLIQKIEDAFSWWGDEADVTGNEDIYGLMRLAKTQQFESGAFLFVKRYLRDSSRFIPYALQAIEIDSLQSSPTGNYAKGNGMQQGIEYDKGTGRAIRYHFTDPDGWGKTIDVPASEVVHGFDVLRAGQIHGVSPWVSGVLLAKDLMDYLDNEIDATKTASKWLAFVTKEPGVRTSSLDDGVGDDEGKKIDELESTIIEYLNQGENIEIASNPRPGTSFAPTVKLIERLFCAATNIPYELLSFDYSGINYTTSRVIRNDYAKHLEPQVSRFVRKFCAPVAKGFFNSAYLSNRLTLPNYLSNPMPYFKWDWQPPGRDSIDPLRESKSRISEMSVLLETPQKLLRQKGIDFDQAVQETAAAVKKLEDSGLGFIADAIWRQQSISVANNPAAVENQNGNGSKRVAVNSTGINQAALESMLMDALDSINADIISQ